MEDFLIQMFSGFVMNSLGVSLKAMIQQKFWECRIFLYKNLYEAVTSPIQNLLIGEQINAPLSEQEG